MSREDFSREMIGVGDLVARFMDEDEENHHPQEQKQMVCKEAAVTSVDSDGFEIIANRDDAFEADASSSLKNKKQKEKNAEEEEEKRRIKEEKKSESERLKQKKEKEKEKRAEEKETKKREREKEMEEKRLKREKETEEREKKRKEREKEMEEKRLKREEEKRAREEKKRREQEDKDRIEEEKRKEKERLEALKRKQSEKLLGFFKQKSPKKMQKTSSALDVVASPSKKHVVEKLDEELFNKSKALEVDVVQSWLMTLKKFKAERRMNKENTETTMRHWNARVHVSPKDFDPFRAKSSSPEDGDDDEVQIIKDDGGDVQIVDAPEITTAKDKGLKRYKKYYSFASYEMNYHERLPWYGYGLPPGRPTLSQPFVKKMARNYRRKCDEVDYGCDSGGEDYEYESEGEDIMDDGDDLDEEDEDLADEEDEEEDGQEFFIPDTRIIRGEFGQDDEEENLDAIRREDSGDATSIDPSTPTYVSKSKARRTVQQWVGEAKKQRKTLVVTSLAGSSEDGITQDADGVVLKGFEIISRTMKGVIICGVDYEEAKKKIEDEAERAKLEQKKMKAKEKKAAKEETKEQNDAAKNEIISNNTEFGKTTFVTQEGLDKLFKINNAGTKRMLDAWVKPKDDKLAVEETEIVEMPAVPESTDSEIWESFRNKLLETNAANNSNPLGKYALWFDADQMDVTGAVVRQMPTNIAKLIAKLTSQAGRPQVARVELFNAMTKIISITRDMYLRLETGITFANGMEALPIKKAAPMPVLLEEAATAPSIKNMVASIFSSPDTSRALRDAAFALVWECVVNMAHLDPARQMWRNDIIRNVCHEKNFLDAAASYFLNSSKGEQHNYEQAKAMQIANEITKGALCDTFCVMRSLEASRLALALCDFVSHTFGDDGGLKSTNLEDFNANGKEYTLAFRTLPEAIKAISNMVTSCPNVFESSKVCEGIEKTGKFVSRLTAIFGPSGFSSETKRLTEDAVNVLKSAVGFGTEKRSSDCLIKTLGDCGDVIVTLSLFNHPTITEVKDFVQKRMENIRENKAILEEVGIDQ